MMRGRHGGLDPLHPRVSPWIGDIIAAVFIVASAYVPFPGTEFRPADPLALALVLAPALILPLRRRWPLPVLAACVAIFALSAFLGTLWPGVVLSIAIAMFGVANRSSRRATLITALVTVPVVVLISVLAAIGSVYDLPVFAVAITVAFAAAAGDAARSGREYIVAITERAERAEETRESEARRRVSEERLRIARDLHDAVAHQIAVISLNAGVASSAIPSRPDDAEQAVRTIRSAARTVLGEIGALLEVLRTDGEDHAAEIAPQPGLDRIGELIAQFEDAGLAVTVRTEGDPSIAGEATGIVAYRVIQEALTNAHKHGAESRAHVLVRADDDMLHIVVTNPMLPGGSRDARDSLDDAVGSGLGLIGVRERVAAVRGVVETGPTSKGWRVAASLPLSRETHP
jgi:signal transduction histidine kinase